MTRSLPALQDSATNVQLGDTAMAATPPALVKPSNHWSMLLTVGQTHSPLVMTLSLPSLQDSATNVPLGDTAMAATPPQPAGRG